MNHRLTIKSSLPRNEATSHTGFRVSIRNEGDHAELLIMEPIGKDLFGDGVDAKGVVDFLNANKRRKIEVRINSPGGLVYDGLVIYNALRSHDARVTATIEGLAFSAASFIAMGADHLRMFEASDIGIHRALAGTIGNAHVMQDMADWLTTIDDHLVDIYQAKTGKSREQINGWLDGTNDGTVFTAKEAVELGFADELIPLSRFSNSKKRPPKLQAAMDAAKKRKVKVSHASR